MGELSSKSNHTAKKITPRAELIQFGYGLTQCREPTTLIQSTSAKLFKKSRPGTPGCITITPPDFSRITDANDSPEYAARALVAQLDRVLASEAKGRGFDSRRARHFSQGPNRTHR